MQVTLCDFCDMPTDGHDCRRALWSDMRYCRTCHRDECYRQGWDRKRVIADNERLVKEKNMPEKRYLALPGSTVYHDAPEVTLHRVGGAETWFGPPCMSYCWSEDDPALVTAPPPGRRYCKRCERIAARKEKT